MKLRRSAGKQRRIVQRSLDQQLARETLLSERLRATLLAVTYGLLLLFFLGFSTAYPAYYDRLVRGQLPAGRIIAFLAIAAAYELMIWAAFGIFFRRRQRLPAFSRYFNSLLETSVPTIVVLLTSPGIHAPDTLLSPASLAYFLFIILSALRLDFKLCVFTGLVAAAEYLGLVMIPFSPVHDPSSLTLALPSPYVETFALLALGGLATGLVTVEIRRRVVDLLKMVREKDRIISILGQHVSPVVADKLLTQDTPDTGGESRYVCVMFLDIRGFSALSRQHGPEELVAYLNTLFDFMVEIINNRQGVINKFLGDGFMALFGAFDSKDNVSQQGVSAALEIIERVQREQNAGRIPPTKLGIGLHTGEVITGNVGTSLRREYTAIGDTVNLAARIERLNREFDSQLLISDAVLQAIDGGVRKRAVPQQPVLVKGHAEPLLVYKLA